MNYLTEVLAFMAWQQKHPLTPLLQSYWHWLLYFNNAAALKGEDGLWYWPVAFNVPNTVMMGLLGLKDRREIVRQRGHLCAHSLVTYQKDSRRRAGKYTLIPFEKGLERRQITPAGKTEKDTVWDNPANKTATALSPYINNINYKHTSPLGYTPKQPPSASGFNLLPQLTEEEKAVIAAQYPNDKIAQFQAMWQAREQKQEKGER